MHTARRELRAALRAQRKAVPPAARLDAARRVAAHADAAFHLRARQRIALYSPLDEELDAGPLLELAVRRGCDVYLPRIEDFMSRRMTFRRYSGTLELNRFGIGEPRGIAIAARWLSLVFVPLVAFDGRGARLGMGAGFYDRAFGWRHMRGTWRGPRLIGLAYAFQQVPALEPAAHDVYLDAVVTEQGVIRCSTGS